MLLIAISVKLKQKLWSQMANVINWTCAPRQQILLASTAIGCKFQIAPARIALILIVKTTFYTFEFMEVNKDKLVK